MKKLVLIAVITSCLSIITFAQQEKYTSPINWERYKISEKDVSILLPKIPVFHQTSNACDEKESNNYAVYAEDVVYQLKIISKSKRKIPDDCDVKNKFGKETLEKRLKELKTLSVAESEKKFEQEKKEVIEFKEKLTTLWIFNDLENDKWVELSMTYREDIKPDSKRFRESLKFEQNLTGKEIGEGSAALGDETLAQKDDTNLATEKDDNLYIVSKVPPKYTDGARKENIQGEVMLRVTFLANGGIGSVSLVSALPYGLTEQAITAAKKITFLPARKKGKKIAIVKIVQYSFKIY